jgi:hypothetical protein
MTAQFQSFRRAVPKWHYGGVGVHVHGSEISLGDERIGKKSQQYL